MKRSAQTLLIAVAFDIYWALVVMFRDQGVWLWLALALLACLMLSPVQRRYALLLAVAGCALDSLWVVTDFIRFNSEAFLPLWMISLWLMFATVWTWLTHHTELSRGLLVLSATLGGPFAYFIGERLRAIIFLEPTWWVLSGMAVGWLILMLLFHKLIGRQQCVS